MSSRGNTLAGYTAPTLPSFSPPGTLATPSQQTLDRLFAVPRNDATGGAQARWAAADNIVSRLQGNRDFERLAANYRSTPRDMVYDMLRSWYTGRMLGFVAAAQLAARDVFHLTHTSADTGVAFGDVLWEKYPDAFRGFVRAQYVATQSMFAQAGITALTLYRGLGVNDAASIPRNVNFDGNTHQIDITMRPLTSFSASKAIGEDYATSRIGYYPQSMLISADVPVSRILSMPLTGFGIQDQQEVIVLGGTQNVSYTAQEILR